MKIYMDACCLNRPFDDLSQERVMLESDAVLAILDRCKLGNWQLIGSNVVDIELRRIKNTEKLKRVQSLYSAVSKKLKMDAKSKQRAAEFQSHGIKVFDSYHLAVAETNGLDALLTTDDAFLKNAKKLSLNITVENPVSWFMEVLRNER